MTTTASVPKWKARAILSSRNPTPSWSCSCKTYHFCTTVCSRYSFVCRYKRDGFNLLFSLRGEFAFVLYDIKRQLRETDSGSSPLYYTVSNGSILFGSEIKAFMGLGWQAEWDIECIVNHGDLCDERTVFKRVKKVRVCS